MPEGVGYGSQSIFAGSSKSFSFIDNRIYAYTGSVTVDENETVLFESKVGKGYVVAKWQPVYFQTSTTDDATFIVKFNGIEIFLCTVTGSTTDTPFQEIDLVIPPLTLVTLTGYNRTDTSDIKVGGIITGKIYGSNK